MFGDGGNVAANQLSEFSDRTLTPVQPVDDDKPGLIGKSLQYPRLLLENTPILHSSHYLAIWPNRQKLHDAISLSIHQFTQLR